MVLQGAAQERQPPVGLETTEVFFWASGIPAAVRLRAISAFLQRVTLRLTWRTAPSACFAPCEGSSLGSKPSSPIGPTLAQEYPEPPAARSRSSPDPKGRSGSQSCPNASVVERTFAWLSRNRCLAKDFETHVENAAAYLQIATIKLLTHRLARV